MISEGRLTMTMSRMMARQSAFFLILTYAGSFKGMQEDCDSLRGTMDKDVGAAQTSERRKHVSSLHSAEPVLQERRHI